MNICFKNIRVIEPIKDIDEKMNLWVKDGVIQELSHDAIQTDSDARIIDGSNLVCAPGLFDMHVHLREPGQEYKEDVASGSNAAANGGFTGICCMPNTEPAIDNITTVSFIKQKAKDLLVDVEISAAITQKREGKLLSPMMELDDYGAVMFTDDGSAVSNSEVMQNAFNYSVAKDLLIAQHCEDHTLTEDFSANEGEVSCRLGLKGYPSVAEEIIVSRDLILSEYSGNRRYHVSHISTAGAVRLVRDAKKRGLRVSCEVTPHHISLTDENLETYHPNYKMNPPLRTEEDIIAILDGLKDDTIECIASDHAPHALHEKDVEFELAPNGILGLETSLAVCLTYLVKTEVITLNQLIEKMSVNPRRILKLSAIKIEKGAKANLTIFSPDEEWIVNEKNFKSKAKNSPYIGAKLFGRPKFAINNGKLFESIL